MGQARRRTRAGQTVSVPQPPELVLFDVNETLSDMAPLAERFADVGLPTELARTWFASTLRDGFALAATGRASSFRDIAEAAFRALATGQRLDRPEPEAVAHVIDGFWNLDVHPDVAQGLTLLAGAGVRLATLSNGASSVAESLLERAGLRQHVERVLSVEDAGLWKPAAAAYAYGLDACGVAASEAMLVAVHPWDINGAALAGMRTGWLNRQGLSYPPFFEAPEQQAGSLVELAGMLIG